MLAFTAPIDALLAATMVNEWACTRAADDGAARAAVTGDPAEPRLPLDEAEALAALRERIAAEAQPALRALVARAGREGVPLLFDETDVSIGYGVHGRTWPLVSAPAPDTVAWDRLGRIPVALVTGSNGKTTTVRLVAAMLAAAGHVVGFCCSDGVFVGGDRLERGDWSGPAGARRVLRDQRVTAAVLETARGGLLRRGLACPSADAAIITNIAEDHLGGYGVTSLDDLAEVKCIVAHALGRTGTLVLNADDALLGRVRHGHEGPVQRFSAAGPPDFLPPVLEMPLTIDGAARHNVENIAGASLVARALGVPDEAIRRAVRAFGAQNTDNPGRLERFERGGVRIWIDYAHNPHGLAALLDAARGARGDGRLGLLLGQAGDRDDEAIRALGRAAWAARPDRVVLKDLDGYLRGREPGEVPAILRRELVAAGAHEGQLELARDETDGVLRLLAWARPGDLLVMPVHALDARERAITIVQNWT
jgi:cyanophycin synthetase